MGSDGVELEVLFRAGCFPGLFQGCRTKGGSKVLSFYLLVYDVYQGNEKGG